MTRLKRVTRSDLTVSRRKSGRGYMFIGADGTPVRDPELLARIRQLVIPPAWTGVAIAENGRAHIQCCGTDEAGRVQYIYHSDWEARRTGRKLRSVAALTAGLSKIRRRVAHDLDEEAGSRSLALAIAVALIDRTAMRVGRERYLDEHGTRGAGTLFTRDVTITDDNIAITFPAKSGKTANYEITDAKLAAAIARIKSLPGKRLLAYRNAEGKVRPIRTEAINDYLRDIVGAGVTAKDFRTLHASALAGDALAGIEVGASASARKRQIAEVTRTIAETLRNTPMVCRKSYIVPCLFKLFDEGKLSALWHGAGRAAGSTRLRERRLGAVLAAAA